MTIIYEKATIKLYYLIIKMAKNKQIWVSPSGNNWRVHRPGAARSIKITDTQQEGFEKARQVARNQGGELIMQGRNGQIREKNSYSPPRDNFPPKG